MRTKSILATAAVALTLALSACSAQEAGMSAQPASTAPAAETAMEGAEASGTFAGLNDKQVSGTATISGGMVQLSGFSSDEGPDLHLYLADGTDEAAVSAGVELGPVAYDEASQSFMLNGADVSGSTHLVVYCKKAKAVFGAAELS